MFSLVEHNPYNIVFFGAVGLSLSYVLYWIYKHNPSLDRKALRDKNVIITGASTGIGKQMAFEIAKAGAHIMITGLEESLLSSVAQTCKTLGAKSIDYIALDLSIEENCHKFTEKCVSNFKDGRIDYLFLNHMLSPPYEEWINMRNMHQFNMNKSINTMNKAVAVNINSHIMIASVLYEYLEKSKCRLVYVSSLASCIIAPYITVYGACKHAMSAFFDNWRTELQIHKSEMSITICWVSFTRTKTAVSRTKAFAESLGKRSADPNTIATRIISGAQKRLQFVYAPFIDCVVTTILAKVSMTLTKWITCKLHYGRIW